jgi:hypothetical protein
MPGVECQPYVWAAAAIEPASATTINRAIRYTFIRFPDVDSNNPTDSYKHKVCRVGRAALGRTAEGGCPHITPTLTLS